MTNLSLLFPLGFALPYRRFVVDVGDKDMRLFLGGKTLKNLNLVTLCLLAILTSTTQALSEKSDGNLLFPFLAVEGSLESKVISALATTIRLLDTDNSPEIAQTQVSYNFIFVSAVGSIVEEKVQEEYIQFLRPKSISAIVSSIPQAQNCHITRLNYRDGTSTVVAVHNDSQLEVVDEEMLDCFSRGVEIFFVGDEPLSGVTSWQMLLAQLIKMNLE